MVPVMPNELLYLQAIYVVYTVVDNEVRFQNILNFYVDSRRSQDLDRYKPINTPLVKNCQSILLGQWHSACVNDLPRI